MAWERTRASNSSRSVTGLEANRYLDGDSSLSFTTPASKVTQAAD